MLTRRISAALPILATMLVLAPGLAFSQTSVGASLYGAFTGTTTGNGTQQSPSNSAGALIEVRHIDNPILGFEGTYSYNRADQHYSYTGAVIPVCPGCPSTQSVSVPANAHEITGDWTPSVHISNFRPFGVLGLGLLLNVPSVSQAGGVSTSTSTKAVYVYGAGLDWGLLPHLGLRFQYRGNLYEAPNLSKLYSSTNAFTHTAEPMIGIYLHL
jgi:opacity protein-like surface antigen